MSRPWMPLYVADYLRDTRRLTAAEHGAYLLLIMEYWTSGGLPDDDRQLCRIACMSVAEWRRARPNIQSFFRDGWKHKRIDAELAKSLEISSKRSASAKQMHSKRSANADANAEQLDTHARASSQSQPQSQEKSSLRSDSAPKRTRAKPRVPLPELWQLEEQDFEYASQRGFPPDQTRSMAIAFANHHRGKGNLMADWHAAWRTWCENEIKFNANRGNGNGSAQIRPNSSITESLRRELAELERPESSDCQVLPGSVLRISDRSVR